jgi:hypothetical protein
VSIVAIHISLNQADGGAGNRTRVGGLLPRVAGGPDLASADADESASNERYKRQAADDELPAIHPGQLNVFDSLGDG